MVTNKNNFDAKARSWDDNPVHVERSRAIAAKIIEMIPLSKRMRAMEYGAGTAMLGELLSPYFNEIVLIDSSEEMVEVMKERIAANSLDNLTPVVGNLETDEYQDGPFDVIYSQMVFHHVKDIGLLLSRLYNLLNRDGYLVIADLYKEDGSFHGEGFSGHNGFDVDLLKSVLESENFKYVKSENCFKMKKIIDGQAREYPLFLMIGRKDL